MAEVTAAPRTFYRVNAVDTIAGTTFQTYMPVPPVDTATYPLLSVERVQLTPVQGAVMRPDGTVRVMGERKVVRLNKAIREGLVTVTTLANPQEPAYA